MVDLSHWDAALHFTADEAAALAVGIDPLQPENGSTKSKPTYERMQHSYDASRRWHRDEFQQGDEPGLIDRSEMLDSIEMQWLATQEDPEDGAYFSRWLSDNNMSGLETQKFNRNEVARWLTAVGLGSCYAFQALPSSTKEEPAGHWPWGSHHTKTLGYLEAAAKHWWVNYDPADVTTAPSNKEVIDWLQKEFSISDNKANSIASMLRGDDIPTGPHK